MQLRLVLDVAIKTAVSYLHGSVAGNLVSAVSRSSICPFPNCMVKLLPHVDSLVVPSQQFLKVHQEQY